MCVAHDVLMAHRAQILERVEQKNCIIEALRNEGRKAVIRRDELMLQLADLEAVLSGLNVDLMETRAS